MKMLKNKKTPFFLASVFFFFIFLISCGKTPIPRPYGYFRVDLPPHTYEKFDSAQLPYAFEKSSMAVVKPHNTTGERCWIDIFYPSLNASIYCSYKPVQANLIELLEDTRKIVYKHTVRADAIDDKLFVNREKKVYGIFYDLEGNTASQAQFILTDSTKHFLTANLYFNSRPKPDSLAPAVNYIKKDLLHLIDTFQWK